MKIQLTEYDMGFSLELTPESMEDLSSLVRFTANRTTKNVTVDTYVPRSGSPRGVVRFDKRKNPTSYIQPIR